MMLKLNKEIGFAILLIGVIIILSLANFERIKPLHVEKPENIIFDRSTNTLSLNSLTLKQKIAQMIISEGKEENAEVFQNMCLGGIFLFAKPTKVDFINTINKFQIGSQIPFFVTLDLEGCGNPFSNFEKFPSFREINTTAKAYRVGYREGELLRELGFKINFSPVVDLTDTIWNCRNFIGTPEDISEKAKSYIKGLQDNGIIATSKHYPGKTLSVKDPHQFLTFAQIDSKDLLPFEETIKDNVSAIMVSHIIVNGSVNSESKPAVVSQELIAELRREFKGLIITDEVSMLGLKNYYSSTDSMYIDLFKADNDVILIILSNPKEINLMISVIEDAVKRGEISEKRIDDSVTRILNAKGIKVN